MKDSAIRERKPNTFEPIKAIPDKDRVDKNTLRGVNRLFDNSFDSKDGDFEETEFDSNGDVPMLDPFGRFPCLLPNGDPPESELSFDNIGEDIVLGLGIACGIPCLLANDGGIPLGEFPALKA